MTKAKPKLYKIIPDVGGWAYAYQPGRFRAGAVVCDLAGRSVRYEHLEAGQIIEGRQIRHVVKPELRHPIAYV